jgi:hypothetical protein
METDDKAVAKRTLFLFGAPLAAILLGIFVYQVSKKSEGVAKTQYIPLSPSDDISDQVRMTQAIGSIKDRLRDPASADFSGFYVSRKLGIPIVCGYVNARNGFGGMSGKERFFVSQAGGALESEGMEEMERDWNAFC